MVEQLINNEKLVYIILYVFIVLYGKIASPNIPLYIQNVVKSNIGRLIILSFIAYQSNNNIKISIIASLGFIVIMDLLKEEEIKESYINLEKFTEIYDRNN